MEFKPFSLKQMKVISDPLPRITILDGSVRSGKTMAANIRWTKMLREAPPGDLLMSGKTKHTIQRNVLNDLFDLWGKRNYSFNQSDGVIHAFGRRIYVVGASDEKAEGKIRGMSISGYYGDEESLKPESFFDQVQTRMDKPGAKAIITTNPDNPYHWLKRKYIDNKDLYSKGILKRYHFTLKDNLALDPEVVHALENSFSGVFYKRMILGMWVVAEGIIYDMFDESKHIFDNPPNDFSVYEIPLDYGTNNPFAALKVGIKFDEETDKPIYYVLDEYYYDSNEETGGGQLRGQKTDSQYYRDLDRFIGRTRTPVQRIIMDPSAASFEAEIRFHGKYTPVHAENEVVDGIRVVSDAFREGRIKIHRNCTNLIREIFSYSWDPKAAEKGEDKPLKKNDHACDALRYLVYYYEGGQGEINIRSFDYYKDEFYEEDDW